MNIEQRNFENLIWFYREELNKIKEDPTNIKLLPPKIKKRMMQTGIIPEYTRRKGTLTKEANKKLEEYSTLNPLKEQHL